MTVPTEQLQAAPPGRASGRVRVLASPDDAVTQTRQVIAAAERRLLLDHARTSATPEPERRRS